MNRCISITIPRVFRASAYLCLLSSALLQLGLDLPDEGGRDALLELVGGRVQVEYLDNLRHLER